MIEREWAGLPGLAAPGFRLGGFVAVAYLVLAIACALWPGHGDETSATGEILWNVFLIGRGVLLIAGLRLVDDSPWAGVALVSAGVLAGALPTFWVLIPLVVAGLLVVLRVLHARRRPQPGV